MPAPVPAAAPAAVDPGGAGSEGPPSAAGRVLPLHRPLPATADRPPDAIATSAAPAHQLPGEASILEPRPVIVPGTGVTSTPDATGGLQPVHSSSSAEQLLPLSIAEASPAVQTRSYSGTGVAAPQSASIDTGAAQHPPEPPPLHMVLLAQAEEVERSLLTGDTPSTR
jgi:hypothetical protein